MAEVIIVTPEANKQSAVENTKLISNNVNGENKKRDTGIKCQVDLGSGNTKCCVSNCSTNALSNINKAQVTFITFPKDPSRFTEWTRAIERPDLLPYMGKKEAKDLLLCSKHFPENMWVNSNTRLKRLHKNAVPEINSDDEVDIIAINPANEKYPSSTKKGGLKIKKVSSLLTESALKETLSSPVMDTPVVSILPTLALDSPNKKAVRKWPPILQRPKQTGNTETEKKLLSENGQLKAELDKNMDYILNQKAHYEGILSKEKQKSEELEAKIKVLETAQRKLWHTYEAQLQAQRTVVNTKEVGQKEMIARLKLLQQTNDDVERRLAEAHRNISTLQATNGNLESKITEMNKDEPSPPPPPEPNFTGEKFKAFLNQYLRTEKLLKEKVERLTMELEQSETLEGQKLQLFTLAAKHLNHLQLSWLEVIVNREEAQKEFQEHLKELSLSIYEASEDAYIVCMKTFGLAPLVTVQQWAKEATTNTATANSMINALYEEGETHPTSDLKTNVTLEKDITDLAQSLKPKGRMKSKWEREKSPQPKRKRLEREEKNDDDYEEGRVSDEEEEILFSDDSEEEEYEGEDKAESPQPKQVVSHRSFDIPIAASSSSQAPQADFDFILDEEEEVTSQNANIQLGNSMPLLVPDSPMTPIPNFGTQSSELKISSRKKVISSDASLPSGSKVVFRVIES